MQILYRNVVRAAIVPVKFTTTLVRLTARLGAHKPQTTAGLGVVRGFKTSANFLLQNKHHVRRRIQNKLLKEMGASRAANNALFGFGSLISSVAGLCSLACFGLVLSADPSPNEYSPMWPTYVLDRNRAMSAYLGGAISIAALTAFICSRIPAVRNFLMFMDSHFMISGTFISTAGICKAISTIPFQPDENGLKLTAFAAFSVLLGASLVAMSRSPLLLETVTIALFGITGLNIVILFAPSKTFLHDFRIVGLTLGAIIGIVGVSICGPTAASTISVVPATQMYCAQLVFAMIFLGLVMHRTKNVIEHAETLPPDQIHDPINAAISILLPG